MRSTRSRAATTVALAAALALVAPTAADSTGSATRQGTPAAAGDRLVLLVSIDGFPAEAFADPTLPIPNLRRLAAEGAAAVGMRPANPSVTWPTHTSFVTGVTAARHQVLYNGLLVRPGPGLPPRVEPWRDKREMVRATTVYDKAHAAGLTTAQVDWVAIQNPGTITWAFPERPDPEGPIEREMVAAGVLTRDDVAQFAKRPVLWRDHAWTDAGIHILTRHRPNLLLFHLLNVDSTHHRYGHNTPAGATALAHADTQLGRLLAAVDATGRREQTTVLVVSDHGFKTVRRQVRPNVVLRREGLLTGSGVDGGSAYVLAAGGIAQVYLSGDASTRQPLAERVRSLLAGVEGVQRVFVPAEYGAIALPTPDASDQAGDLVLAAADGYAFSSASDGEVVVDATLGGLGAHGYLNGDPEMRAIFVAAGRDIRAGTRLDVIDAADVAAIIAARLGLDMGAIDGRVPAQLISH
jgi:predicted AlkP superfamily pyrophosphatase or phosphodiesterase